MLPAEDMINIASHLSQAMSPLKKKLKPQFRGQYVKDSRGNMQYDDQGKPMMIRSTPGGSIVDTTGKD
jgi:hypothetical protein